MVKGTVKNDKSPVTENTVVKKTRKSKDKETPSVSQEQEPEVKVPPPQPATPVVDVPAEVVVPAEQTVVADVETLSSKLNVFSSRLQQLSALLSSVKSDYKLLEKNVARELKNAHKHSSKKNKSSGNRQPSGFVKPTRISDELAVFLGKPVGSEMARTDVSKEINQYIRTNGLQDKANGRKINADAKLASLLKLKKEDELTYFNLQRFMKHHFIKAEPVSATPVAV